MFALGVTWRKRSVDRGDLIRVNRELAAEPIAARRVELLLQAGRIAKVGADSLDRLCAERRRVQKTLSARELEGEGERPVAVPLPPRTERSAHRLGTPGQTCDPLAQRA